MNYREIGRRIREERKKRRLSQEELAEKINISVTHMSHIETGNTKLSLPVLVDLANVLNVSTDKLLKEQTEDSAAINEVVAAMAGCSTSCAEVIVDIVRATRQAMEKHIERDR